MPLKIMHSHGRTVRKRTSSQRETTEEPEVQSNPLEHVSSDPETRSSHNHSVISEGSIKIWSESEKIIETVPISE